jgi:WD40 repeat protein
MLRPYRMMQVFFHWQFPFPSTSITIDYQSFSQGAFMTSKHLIGNIILVLVIISLCAGCRPVASIPPTATKTTTPTSTHTPAPTPTPTITPFPQSENRITVENAAQVEELARYGQGWLTSAAFSPDGETLAVGSSLGVYFYETENWEVIDFLETEKEVTRVAYSPNGKYLAIHMGQSLQVFEELNASMKKIFEAEQFYEYKFNFSPNSELIAYVDGGDIFIVRLEDNRLISRLQRADDEFDNDFYFNQTGTIIYATWNGDVQAWSVITGKQLSLIKNPSKFPRFIFNTAYNPTTNLLAGRLEEYIPQKSSLVYSLFLVDPLTNTNIYSNHIENTKPISIDFSSPGGKLATGDENGIITLMNISMRELLLRKSFQGHEAEIHCTIFSPDDQYIITTSQDNTLKIWGVNSTELLAEFDEKIFHSYGYRENTEYYRKIYFSPTRNQFVWIPNRHTLKVINLDTLIVEKSIDNYFDPFLNSAVFPDSNQILLSSSANRLHLIEQQNDLNFLENILLNNSFSTFTISPDGNLYAYATINGDIHICDSHNKETILIINNPDSIIRALAFSPDGKTLASGKKDETIDLWQVDNGKLISTILDIQQYDLNNTNSEKKINQRLTFSNTKRIIKRSNVYGGAYPMDIQKLSFSADGHYLIAYAKTLRLYCWSVPGYELIYKSPIDDKYTSSPIFSADYQTIIGAKYDELVNYEVPSFTEAKTYHYEEPIENLTLSPDGNFFVATTPIYSDDDVYQILFIKVSDGSIFARKPITYSPISSLNFSSDGEFLYSTSYDGTMRIWGLPTDTH